jgi:3-isopropylmalate/(R)-2-methylmalate dehydratase small subunit|tara:strand:- start:235 stop:840 length:606 start_codon:yes stop_codon:yes gene_type:complete
MEKFNIHEGIAAPMPLINIDTDMLIPKQFLKTIKRTGLGENLFFEMRYDQNGNEIKDFILNKEHYKDASIIVGGANFGCGSSREHAPWALKDFGIKCIISISFADIFFNNCFKNGILPIIVSEEIHQNLMKDAEVERTSYMKIDLENQKIIRNNEDQVDFEVDEFKKYCLLNGLDDIGLTLQKSDKIRGFEKEYSDKFSWA